MKNKKGFTLYELLICCWIVFLLAVIFPPIVNSRHASLFCWNTINAKLPADFEKEISIQRDLFECQLAYTSKEGQIKIARYWFFNFWSSEVKWEK